MNRFFVALLVSTSLLMNGCATILTGTSQNVKFSSEPHSVRVEAGGQSCKAPCSLNLEKGEAHIIKFRKKGYTTQTISTRKTFNPVSLLNLLGLVGWIVDVATGALWNVEPEAMNVDMKKKD